MYDTQGVYRCLPQLIIAFGEILRASMLREALVLTIFYIEPTTYQAVIHRCDFGRLQIT